MKNGEPCTLRGVSTVLKGVTPRPLMKISMAWCCLPYELYTMQRYLQFNELKKNGLEHFDSWAANFGETVSAFELSPEGTGYRVKTRFSKFFNLPELMSMFKEVADIKTADMLNLPTPEARFEVLKTLPSEEQKEILASLSERADKVRNRSVEPEEDNMLKIMRC